MDHVIDCPAPTRVECGVLEDRGLVTVATVLRPGQKLRVIKHIAFALFRVLQAGARAENRAIPAKGLTGPGYGGHAFWDDGPARP